MKEFADQVVLVIGEVPGSQEARAEQSIGLPTLRIQLIRDAIARLGVNAEDVLDVIETIGGRSVGTVLEGQERIQLQVRFGGDVWSTLDGIRDLRVSGPAEGDGPPSKSRSASSWTCVLNRVPRRSAVSESAAESRSRLMSEAATWRRQWQTLS